MLMQIKRLLMMNSLKPLSHKAHRFHQVQLDLDQVDSVQVDLKKKREHHLLDQALMKLEAHQEKTDSKNLV